MRARTLATSLLLFLPSVALAQVTQVSANPADNPAARRLVVMPAANLKWEDLGASGIKVAQLWGNYTNGAFGALFKLPAGFVAPLHTHTYDMNVLILAGTYVQVPDGKPEFRLGPGSYFMQPGGSYRHTTSCDPAADCIFLVESKGPFDLKPVAQAKAPAKQ